MSYFLIKSLNNNFRSNVTTFLDYQFWTLSGKFHVTPWDTISHHTINQNISWQDLVLFHDGHTEHQLSAAILNLSKH